MSDTGDSIPNLLLIEVLGTMKSKGGPLEPFPVSIGFTIRDITVFIGSQPLSPPSILLSTVGVSRRQCKVFYADNAWYIHDLGSDNGTWLSSDGQFIFADRSHPLKIADGSLILLGTVLARFTCSPSILS